ncbi:hypothetical protein OXX79_001362 [Metschnikowia pulcherrima]
MNSSPAPETPRKAEKRAPTTPLLPSKHQNKKNSTVKHNQFMPKSMSIDAAPGLDSAYEQQLLDSRLQIWALEKRLQEQTELTAFLELERQFSQT